MSQQSYTVKKGDIVTLRDDYDGDKKTHVNFSAGGANIAYQERTLPSYNTYADRLRDNNQVTHHPAFEYRNWTGNDDRIEWDKSDPRHKRNDANAVLDSWNSRYEKSDDDD